MQKKHLRNWILTAMGCKSFIDLVYEFSSYILCHSFSCLVSNVIVFCNDEVGLLCASIAVCQIRKNFRFIYSIN